MRVGLKLVREGLAAGFVTAGNTGAAMATAKMVLGALPGVDRPALATPMPSSKGNPCVLLDVGANVDCKAHNLAQFAVMGEIYARTVLKIDSPRVGLLTIGEEESKGNDLTHEAFPLLKALPIRFVGNVEGRDIFSGLADVIVCDGFVGNVALKTSEGVGRFVRDVLRESLTRTVTAQVGALLSARPSTNSAIGSTIASTAARLCWGCAAFALSATAHRMIAPSTTAFAWRTNRPRRERSSASKPSLPAVRRRDGAGPEPQAVASSGATVQ